VCVCIIVHKCGTQYNIERFQMIFPFIVNRHCSDVVYWRGEALTDKLYTSIFFGVIYRKACPGGAVGSFAVRAAWLR